MTSLPISANRDPSSGKLTATYGWHPEGQMRITGSGFGDGPNVVFFDRVSGADLSAVVKTSPEIGEWWTVTNSGGIVSRVSVVGGRSWMTARDPLKVTETTENKTQATFNIPPSQELFFCARLAADPTKIMIGANSVGAPVTQTASIFKPFWLSDNDNTKEWADIVLGTWVGGGAYISGNSVQPAKASDGSQYYYPNFSGRPIDVNASNLVGYYQSGRESTAGAKDAKIELYSSSSNGTTILSALGNPYAVNDAGTGLTKFDYDKLFWGAYFGNLTNANFANIQALAADFYCAVGANARARLVLSNNAVLASSTESYIVPPDYWSGTEILFTPVARENLGFYHLILANGTLVENVTAVLL